MLKERLQILVSAEQRKRLEAEARSRGTSMGEIVREALDQRYSEPSREAKLRAWDEIKAMNGGRAPEPGELNRIVEEGVEQRLERAGADPRSG
jgi:hypothetical protein